MIHFFKRRREKKTCVCVCVCVHTHAGSLVRERERESTRDKYFQAACCKYSWKQSCRRGNTHISMHRLLKWSWYNPFSPAWNNPRHFLQLWSCHCMYPPRKGSTLLNSTFFFFFFKSGCSRTERVGRTTRISVNGTEISDVTHFWILTELERHKSTAFGCGYVSLDL